MPNISNGPSGGSDERRALADGGRQRERTVEANRGRAITGPEDLE